MDFPHLGARVNDRDRIALPRPIQSGLAVAAAGFVPLGLGLANVIRPLSGLVFAAIFLAVGALLASLAYHELVGIRRRADLELRSQPRPYLVSSFARWRAAELTADRHRLALARAVTRTERDLSPALLPGASPLNRVAARPHVELFRELAERLSALDRPVTPQAVLQVEELLTSSESPLYARERASELRGSLLDAIHAVDGDGVLASGQRRIRAGRKRIRTLAGATTRLREAMLDLAPTHLRRVAMAHRRSQR